MSSRCTLSKAEIEAKRIKTYLRFEHVIGELCGLANSEDELEEQIKIIDRYRTKQDQLNKAGPTEQSIPPFVSGCP